MNNLCQRRAISLFQFKWTGNHLKKMKSIPQQILCNYDNNGQHFSTSGNLNVQQKIEIFKLNINYDKEGTGDHPVLCMPGALGFIESDFGPTIKRLDKDKYTIVTWDPPGFGKSRPPDRDFSPGANYFKKDAILAKTLMKKLGYDKFSILGWSDGGITGLVLASLYQDCLKKLVIWGANSFVNENDEKNISAVRDIDKWSPKMKAPMIDMYGEAYFRQTWTNWCDFYIDLRNHNNGDICREDIKSIICPTLILHGMKDPMVGFEHVEYIQQNVKNSRLHIFPEGKHNPHLNPKFAEEFHKLVENFLNEECENEAELSLN